MSKKPLSSKNQERSLVRSSAARYLTFVAAGDGLEASVEMRNWQRQVLGPELAKAHAESEFKKYRIVQDRLIESDFDRMVKQLDNGNDQGGET